MNNRDYQLLKKIADEILIAEAILDGVMEEDFLGDEKLKRAVSMTLINIGELVKNLSNEVKLKDKSIPWREISGLRDLAAHKYQTLRMEDVYLTASKELPTLLDKIQTLLP
jgi:uncharacterized protein with HEPN domain